MKERASCDNTVSVRQAPLEDLVLSTLQDRLLTPEHAELFVAEFRRETQRLSETADNRVAGAQERLAQVNGQIETLARNMLMSEASPTLHRMLAELEAEKLTLEAAQPTVPRPTADILPHPALVALFQEKVRSLRIALDDDLIRTEATSALSSLIESVTIYPDTGDGSGAEAEIAAPIERLISFASNENGPRAVRRGGCSISVVAGAGFEPATFRL